MKYEYMTREGLERIKKELHEYKFNRRPILSQKIAAARELGDLKENAEYHAAREELSLLETKIQKLQERINHARLIDEKDIPEDKVYIFTTVVLKDLDFNDVIEYTLVSPSEANFDEKKISTSSPIGKALLGKSKGDQIAVQVPAGILNYEILNIKKID